MEYQPRVKGKMFIQMRVQPFFHAMFRKFFLNLLNSELSVEKCQKSEILIIISLIDLFIFLISSNFKYMNCSRLMYEC